MAELTHKEHLQPSLLDRLIDDEPNEKKKDKPANRILTFRKLKQSVMRDLQWLLNAGCLEKTEELSNFPEVKQSVLNYGIPDLTGSTASSVDSVMLRRTLKDAILYFEPCILERTLNIRVTVNQEHMNPNTIIYEIEGELWAQPLPERLFFKTIIDLELGTVEVQDQLG